jgi:branched-chain amino acid transport system permease protein
VSDVVPAGSAAGASAPEPGAATGAGAVPPVYRQNYYAGVLVVIAVGLAASLLTSSGLSRGLLVTWAIYAIAGLGFYLVFGLSGQFAFSQGAFLGVGAYTSAWASRSLGFLGGFVAAIVVSAVLALLLGYLVRRSSSFYFAIATLAFGSMAAVLFRELEWFTGPSGEVIGIDRPSLFGYEFRDDRAVFLLALGVLAIGLVLVAWIQRSALRRQVIAVRDNEAVAAVAGIPTLKIRLLFFALGSAFAGAAGSLLAHRTGYLSPDAFALQLGIDLFLVLLLGGMGSMWGPLLGAAFVVWAPEQLRAVGQNQGLVYGVLLVVVVLVLPDGLVGIFDKVRRRISGMRRGSPGGPTATPARATTATDGEVA